MLNGLDAEALLNKLPVGIIQLNQDKRIRVLNNTLASFLGIPVDQMIGRDANELLQRLSNNPGCTTLLRFLLSSAVPNETQFSQITLANESYEIQAKVDSDGSVAAVVSAVSSPATGNGQLELRVRKLEKVINGARLGTWQWNIVTQEIEFNEQWAAVLGYTLDEFGPISIDTWHSLTHPDDSGRSWRHMEAHLNGETEQYSCDVRMRHREGHWIWVRDVGCIVRRDDAGKPVVLAGTHTDITEQKMAEERLRHSEEKFRSLFNNHSAANLVIDTETGQIVDANQVACNFYGWTHAELTARTIFQLNNSSPGDLRAILNDINEQGKNFGQSQHQCKNGSVREVEVYTSKLMLNGKVHLYSVIFDVSEKEQLARRLFLLTKAVEHSPVSIMITDIDGHIEYINPSFTGMTGYTESDLKGKKPSVLKSGIHGKEYYADLWRTIKSGRDWSGEIQNRTRDGRLIWEFQRISPLFDANGRVINYISLTEDITRRKQAEQSLQHYAAMQEIINRISVQYINLPFNEMDSAINSALAEMGLFVGADRVYVFSYDFVRKTASNTHEWCSDGIEPQISELQQVPVDQMHDWVSAHQSGLSVYIPDVFDLEAGSLREILEPQDIKSLLAVPMMSENNCIGFIGFDSVREHRSYSETEQKLIEIFAHILVNIRTRIDTEGHRRKLEEQLTQAQKMEAIGHLAGGVAHDFNNLLTVINGYCDLLILSDADSEVKDRINQILAAGEKAKRLTMQLLAFSRKQVVQPQILNLNQAVREDVNMLGRLLGEDITVTLDLSSEIENVKVDPGQLEQIIMNLAINARDAMPKGGTLTIATERVEMTEEESVKFVDAQPGKYMVLSIADTGTGMDAATRSRIFEPFFTTKGLNQGTGLGLATVYGIVHQNGGFIDIRTAPDSGTTFLIYLPLLPVPKKNDVRPGRDSIKLTGTEEILIVEDEASVRHLSSEILTNAGFRVFTAVDGIDGLNIFKNHQSEIKLVLTDVVMPGMNGKELADQLLETKPDLKIVYCSGYTHDSISHHGILDEDKEFLPKPFSGRELVAKIRDVLDR
jgi:PAS domain S-box-containing protein